MEEYVVQFGDTLSVIAAKKLGDANRWNEIAQLNNLQNPNNLLIGQRLKLPAAVKTSNQSNVVSAQTRGVLLNTSNQQQTPAALVPARGFMFVVFEQLPEVGAAKVVRKVAVIPKDYSLLPLNPAANVSPAEHALGNNNSPFLSTSNRPYGAPKYQGEPLLIDLSMVQAGGTRIYTEQELVLELRRYSAQTGANVDTLIQTIQKAEGEVLIKGGVPGDAVKRVSAAQTPYIETAEEIWSRFEAKKITRPQMEAELEALAKAYNKAKIVGRVGRVLTVVGVVFTAADVANAAQKSYDKRSYKPLAAEAVRQVGGWSGAYAGGILGAEIGAAFGIETGPGAIITGAIGAIIFGAIGYWRGDVIAGWIEGDEAKTELRRDVRSTDNAKTKGITLIVGQNETQFDFGRRALMTAAFNGGLLIESRQREFADKFYSPYKTAEDKTKFRINWTSGDPNAKDGSDMKPEEWEKLRGKEFTYFLNDAETAELIKLMLRGY